MTSTTILLLPGMTLNETIFPTLPLPNVSVDFTTLVLGSDGVTPDLRARGMGVYVDLLDRRLEAMPEWKNGPRIVVAHSFGGMLALAWWLSHQGRGPAAVTGMVLVSTTAGPMFDAVRLRLGRVGSFELRSGIGSLIGMWNRPIVTRTIKRCLSGGALDAKRVDFQRLDRRTDWALDSAGWRNTDWRSMRSYRQALVGFDVRNRLGEIHVPIIVLHGSADTLLPLEDTGTFARALPQGELRIVPGAGHALPLTHGDAVLRAVRDLSS